MANNKRPPKSWALCRHSWANPNFDSAVANSANCFHFCSLPASKASSYATFISPNWTANSNLNSFCCFKWNILSWSYNFSKCSIDTATVHFWAYQFVKKSGVLLNQIWKCTCVPDPRRRPKLAAWIPASRGSEQLGCVVLLGSLVKPA